MGPSVGEGVLGGLKVVELADETAEYCGLLLAGLGATVVKVEPPQGSPTRAIGPFVDDVEDPERSLFYWQYNRGKHSVVLDLDSDDGAERLGDLLERSDIFLESTPVGYLDERGLGDLEGRFPHLIRARVTPFGDDGPWSSFKGSELVHLALGGVAMNCGYDPEPDGTYDQPPIAPQMWHAYHIAGDQTCIAILGALLYRERAGLGQTVSCAVHEAVAKATELDLMSWVMRRVTLRRQTCRHAGDVTTSPYISTTKDGRWFLAYPAPLETRRFLAGQGMEFRSIATERDLSPVPLPRGPRGIPGSEAETASIAEAADLVHRFGRKVSYARVPWSEAQAEGLMWVPLRQPHESLADEHWLMRGTFADVEHPEIGQSVTYAVSRWRSTGPGWAVPSRAPLLGEHSRSVDALLPAAEPRGQVTCDGDRSKASSARAAPFALSNVRILDFTWFLASAGGTRFCVALGAESLKVEWKTNPDTRSGANAPVGGREARRTATGPLPAVDDPDMGGQFLNKNPGKLGLSLNVRHPRGLEIAKQLVEISDVVAEGFSPGVMERWGLGYEQLRQIKPDIIYAQQSGMGSFGRYGRLRAIGPVAAAFSGISEMSGLPTPAMPAGWGYSYLDWIGAYSFASAILSALYHRERTGEGMWIDASQCEAGMFITGTALPDWSVNRRAYERSGNRSPFKKAAPHGIYRCEGTDRWLAIACFEEQEWRALADLAGWDTSLVEGEFGCLGTRLANQDRLDDLVTRWTSTRDAYDAMEQLQRAGVPAGVCQTAEDRCDVDPQLAALNWLVEVTGSKIGTWPIAEVPARMTRTPPYVGGRADRGAPCYGEDTHHILSSLLNMSDSEIEALAADGVI